MKVKDIVAYLNEKPGYRKEGKVRLCHHLREQGYKTNEYDCEVALKVVNHPDKYQMELGNRRFKRLFFDIETSPNLGTFWRPGRKVPITYKNIVKHAAVISISWKWEGEDKVRNASWTNNSFLEWNDKPMLEEFSKVLREADEVIAHNGDGFDVKWLRTRCLKHGIPFPPYIRTLDTLPKFRNNFNFPTNHLTDIGDYLGLGGKIETDYDLWLDTAFGNITDDIKFDVAFGNDKDALSYMMNYNDRDVILLEDIYHTAKHHMKINTHQGVHKGKAKWTCPIDGSENVEYLKPAVSAAGTIQRIMECKDCGHTYKISNSDYYKFINVT